jgi:hypothetical protein
MKTKEEINNKIKERNEDYEFCNAFYQDMYKQYKNKEITEEVFRTNIHESESAKHMYNGWICALEWVMGSYDKRTTNK